MKILTFSTSLFLVIVLVAAATVSNSGTLFAQTLDTGDDDTTEGGSATTDETITEEVPTEEVPTEEVPTEEPTPPGPPGPPIDTLIITNQTAGTNITGGGATNQTVPNNQTADNATTTAQMRPLECDLGTFPLPPTTIEGTRGDDNIVGTAGPDVILALEGDDIVIGLGGNDSICGSEGNDTLYGGDGNDYILGGSDSDYLFGEAGRDQLYGETNDEFLNGPPGNDHVDGGTDPAGMANQVAELAENDVGFGGPGVDRCFNLEEADEFEPPTCIQTATPGGEQPADVVPQEVQ